jgi:hypothetical protein
MSCKTTSLVAAAALAVVAGITNAQVIDGSVPMTAPASGVSTEYGAALALQGTATGFGNNFSELNGAYGTYSGTGAMNLAITGNVEGNSNGFVIFLDSKAGGGIASTAGGGYNKFGSVGGQYTDDWGTDTDGGPGVTPTPGGGSIVNGGFNPEKALAFNYYAPNNAYYFNVIDLTAPNTDSELNRDIYMGQNTPGGGATTQFYIRDFGTTYAGSVTHAFDDSNTAGVNGSGDPVGDPKTATTGMEMSLDSDFLAHEPGKAVRVLAFITNGGGDYLSNQFLPGLHYADAGNAGGAGGFEGSPLIDVRTDAFAQDRDFFITLFEPAFTAGANNKWSTNANWAGNFAPNGVEHDAAFKGAGGNVDLDTNVVLGTLKFNGSAGYNVATTSGSGITMNAGAGASRIDVLAQSNTIHPQLTFATDTRINTGLADVTFDSTVNSGKTITVAGIGTVNFKAQSNAVGSILAVDSANVFFNNDAGSPAASNLKMYVSGKATFKSTQHLNDLGVNAGGRVTMADRATTGGRKVLYTSTLSVAGGASPTGTLDLNDNDLVVTTGSFSTLQALVFAGYRGGPDTTATGIVSSTSQNVHGGTTILALFDNSLAGFPDYPFNSGHTIAANAIVGKYTYIGDTNMDGQVTPQDYTATDSNLGTSVDPAISWFYGDTNFDGNIDPTDYAGIDGALGLGVGNPLSAQGPAAVPEPASIGLLGLGAIAVLRRRRSR